MDTMTLKLRMQGHWIMNNTSFLHRYWSTATTALEAVIQAPEQFEEFEDNELGSGYVDSVISSHLEHHNFAGVLLAYANFDEFFITLTRDLGEYLGVATEPSDLKDRGVRRYKKFIHKVCQIDEATLRVDWDFLGHFAEIRNCIVHTNGNKSKVANARRLDQIVAAYPDELAFKHKVKLVVEGAFVERCINATAKSAMAVVRFMMDRHENDTAAAQRKDGFRGEDSVDKSERSDGTA